MGSFFEVYDKILRRWAFLDVLLAVLCVTHIAGVSHVAKGPWQSHRLALAAGIRSGNEGRCFTLGFNVDVSCLDCNFGLRGNKIT